MTNLPHFWDAAVTHLSTRDSVLGAIIKQFPNQSLVKKHNAFTTLAKSITGQQISVIAAGSIWARLEAALGEISPQAILAADEAIFRTAGYSRQKISYMKNIAQSQVEGALDNALLEGMDPEAAIRHLCQIKGVGRWTAEMFLIFHLHYPDVLPLGDVGLVKALERHYQGTGIGGQGAGSKKKGAERRAQGVGKSKKVLVGSYLPPDPCPLTPEKILSITEPWRPYRTVATWYLWRSLDPVPVEY